MNSLQVLTLIYAVLASMIFLYPTTELPNNSPRQILFIPYTVFIISLNLLLIHIGVPLYAGLLYFITLFIPQLLLVCYYRVRSWHSLVSVCAACLNAFLCFLIVFAVKEAFKVYSKNEILLTFTLYTIAIPLFYCYMRFIYMPLNKTVENHLPNKMWLLLIYNLVVVGEIIVYVYLQSLTSVRVLRANIFATAVLSVYFISIFGFYIFLRAYQEQTEVLSRSQAQKKQIKMMDEYLGASLKNQEKIRILKHDLRHILNNISTLILQNKLDEALEVINSYNENIDSIQNTIYCSDYKINAILCYFKEKCKVDGIPLSITINRFENATSCNLDDLSLIISNLLENAYNAAVECDQPSISFKLVNNKERLILQIQNSTKQLVDLDGQTHEPTTNTFNHGIGTKSIQYYAKKNNLLVDYSVGDHTFKVTILFNE